MRSFRKFSYQEADYRISSKAFTEICNSIVKERDLLENFIKWNPSFLTSLTPLTELPEGAPDIAVRMHMAGISLNVGPMAAVAGTIAQIAAEKVFPERDSGSDSLLKGTEAIVENGGDIFMILEKDLILGIHSDVKALKGKLAFLVHPEETPLAICSSSSTMGHSLSLGNCNLATVFSRSGALADAAATRACNMVGDKTDIDPTLKTISAIPGILGIMIIKGDQIGIAGSLPEIIPNSDPHMLNKITRHVSVSSEQ